MALFSVTTTHHYSCLNSSTMSLGVRPAHAPYVATEGYVTTQDDHFSATDRNRQGEFSGASSVCASHTLESPDASDVSDASDSFEEEEGSTTAVTNNISSPKMIGAVASRRKRQKDPTNSHLLAVTRTGARMFGAESTNAEYERIVDEYKEMLQYTQKNQTMDENNVFKYLLYCAWRPKRANGFVVANVVSESDTEDDPMPEPLRKVRRIRNPFNPQEYDSVMSMLAKRSETANLDDEEEAKKVMELDVVQCIRKHYSALVDAAPDSLKEKLRVHQGIKHLKKEVTGRQKYIARNSFQEKVNPQLEKFGYAVLSEKLEALYWKDISLAKAHPMLPLH